MLSDNPTTGRELFSFTACTNEEVHAAVTSARAAAKVWGRTSAQERRQLLYGFAMQLRSASREIVSAVVHEVGKPVREAREEVERAIAIVEYHAAATLDPQGAVLPALGDEMLTFTEREPLGCVGLITPWNFPVAILLWKLAPALAYGNTVVVKPAPQSTFVATRIADLLKGLPPGVVNIVAGGVETGRALVRSGPDAVSFTGSTRAGLDVAAEALRAGSRYQAEMGGKNASLVFPSANLEAAADCIARAAVGFAGQKCTATSRVIVQESIADSFFAQLADAVDRMPVGDPEEESTVIGPMIDAKAVERVRTFVELAQTDGGRATCSRAALVRPGYFVGPAIVSGISLDSAVAQTEIFGPLLGFFVARDETEAVFMANHSSYGLAAAVFTTEVEQALRVARQLDVGMVRVNGPTPGVPYHAPFAPRRESGLGLPEQGKAAADFFTKTRTITIHGARG